MDRDKHCNESGLPPFHSFCGEWSVLYCFGFFCCPRLPFLHYFGAGFVNRKEMQNKKYLFLKCIVSSHLSHSIACLQVIYRNMLKQKLQLASPYSILGLSMRRRAVGNTAGQGQASWPGHSQGQSQSCRIKSSKLPPDHSWWSTVEEQEGFQPLSQFSYKHSTNCPQNRKEKKHFS